MMKSSVMAIRRPPESESTERNAPSVEAAFQAAPEEMVAQIMNGALHLSPRPARPHANVTSNLGGILMGPFKFGSSGPGGWVIIDEPELHLGPGPDKLVPDLAGWRRERLPRAVGGKEAPAHYDLAPDWACEVLSERTRRRDKGHKMRIYAREGVRHVWHVDPLAQTIDVFRLIEREWLLVHSFAGGERVRAEPFEALELDLALVWSE
ncbi:MAG TPA: Uma2 family endonuclease [Archangium sp.]|uniref:Uma2 family endonuclease n=1 Tax=Archangium sp. TaxID=1872627 RepID=UPI002E37AF53|nr:Uma2 family endonuclease [Archangium sp.]HEX5752495.1 Uma2 family endonuclease [Archangium sp.]